MTESSKAFGEGESKGHEREARLLVVTATEVLAVDPKEGVVRGDGLEGRHPTCLATDPWGQARAWCGTAESGLLRSHDRGRSWEPSGLPGQHVMSVAASPAREGLVWAGTEPSALWRSTDGGVNWEQMEGLEELPSSSDWAFPPKPETHHVRWIACHPDRAGRVWLAIEAGALVGTADGGGTWKDRVPGGPRDTHELALHPSRPDVLRVAAGDGYFESEDGGESWTTPRDGLGAGYLRSVAIDPGDPDVVIVSGASRPRTTYVAGRSDGRLFRREGLGSWERIGPGWPDPPETIAPLLISGRRAGELWAADERGVHGSTDGGRRWEPVAAFPATPSNLRGLALVAPRVG